MKNLSKLVVLLFIGAIFMSKSAFAQLPGGLIPILLLKHETGYWDDEAEPETKVVMIDADGDGITDAEDKCPNVYGTAENQGCPLSEAEREIIKTSSANISFESGSATIKEESYESLKKLAGLLNKHPEIKTRVEGHTDKSGDAKKNLALSKKRAKAVQDYLVKNGESIHNIDSKGYGSEKPIASNDTKEGRAKNRRVEIIVTLLEKTK